jgi:hypothetical protein
MIRTQISDLETCRCNVRILISEGSSCVAEEVGSKSFSATPTARSSNVLPRKDVLDLLSDFLLTEGEQGPTAGNYPSLLQPTAITAHIRILAC